MWYESVCSAILALHLLNWHSLLTSQPPILRSRSSGSLQDTLQPLYNSLNTCHCYSRLVLLILYLSVKPWHLPFRYCRDLSVYGLTTTAMRLTCIHLTWIPLCFFPPSFYMLTSLSWNVYAAPTGFWQACVVTDGWSTTQRTNVPPPSRWHDIRSVVVRGLVFTENTFAKHCIRIFSASCLFCQLLPVHPPFLFPISF